uniref:ATP synthase complex subunit 8 n=1 Tax=Lopinga deidamia TaxID=1165479 RepID=A0A3G4R399_9NEOP|nr:ATP synthase F0 subunit 8 [Lasiommata deidamia]AYU56838.1 ATP synthase F0 subunit 8 [Lasiommata deidamia]
MPQMMPINWMLFFFFFIIIFILFNIINYYIFKYNYNLKNFYKIYKIKKNLNWKW